MISIAPDDSARQPFPQVPGNRRASDQGRGPRRHVLQGQRPQQISATSYSAVAKDLVRGVLPLQVIEKISKRPLPLLINAGIACSLGVIYLPMVAFSPLVGYFIGPDLRTGIRLSIGLFLVFPAGVLSIFFPAIGGILLMISGVITAMPFINEYARFHDFQDIQSLIFFSLPAFCLALHLFMLTVKMGMRRT